MSHRTQGVSHRDAATHADPGRTLAAWAAWGQFAVIVAGAGLLGRRLGGAWPRAAGVGGGGRRRAPRGRLGALAAVAVAAAINAPYARLVARHRPYAGDPHGARHWLVDSTWSAPNTVAGALFCDYQRARGNPDAPDRSTGSGSVWLDRPAVPGYATTVGIVKAGSHARVDAHEDVHVHQARLLGPLYLPLVALDYVLATVLPFWLLERRRRGEPLPRSAREFFHGGVYREVWHERWAYAAAPSSVPPRRVTPR